MSEPINEIYERLNKLKRFMIANPQGVAFKAIKEHMQKDRFMILRDLETIGAKSIEGQRGMYLYSPTQDDLSLAKTIINASDLK